MPINPTLAIVALADRRDALTNEAPPTLAQLAAQVALLESAVITLAQGNPAAPTLRTWLTLAAMPAYDDSPAGQAIRNAALRLRAMLGDS